MTAFFDHFELTSGDNLTSLLGRVEVVLICSSRVRAGKIVESVLELNLPEAKEAVPVGSTEYFTLTRIGKVAVCSHGMGMGTVAICLDELTGMLKVAGCKEISYIRVGSSGGIGTPGGALVITTNCLAENLTTKLHIISQGKDIELDVSTSFELAEEMRVANEGKLPAILGKTISCGTYYEGQARLNGSIAEYSEADKVGYLTRAYDHGARNSEMEGIILANHCKNNTGIKCGMVCASYLVRLHSDRSPANPTEEDFKNAILVAMNWLDKYHREPKQKGPLKVERAVKARLAAGMRKHAPKVLTKKIYPVVNAAPEKKSMSPDKPAQIVQKNEKTWDMSTKKTPSTYTSSPRKQKGIRKGQGFQHAKISKHVNKHIRQHHNIGQPRKMTHSKLGSSQH